MSNMPISISEELQQLQSEALFHASKVEAEIGQLRSALAAKEQEALGKYEMLLEEVQKAFQESEEYFEQWKKTESLLSPFSLECEKIALGEQRNTGPYRSWDITFHQVALLGRRWAQLDLRLVEHHGNAGILIFEGPGPSPALHRWSPNGEESGRRFLLVVPQDHTSQTLLASVPASDLVFLHDAASKLLQQVATLETTDIHSLFWLQVAKRLLQHFHEIPNRIYYDSVKTTILPDSHGHSILRFELIHAYHAGRLFDFLPVQWDVSPSKIHIESAMGKPVPLLAWPINETREPAPEIVLDLANDSPDSPARLQWAKWLNHDRQLVSFIIQEFPNLVYHLFEQHPQFPIPRATLEKKAKEIQDNLRSIASGKQRGILQRLFRK